MAVSHPHPASPIPSISRCLPLGAALGLLAAGCAPAAPPAQLPAERPAPAVEALDARGHYDAAYFAWDTGDYPTALEHAERGLQAQGGDALLRQIALLTGEAYRVRELAAEGRAVRWSPDGSLALFESGEAPAVRTHVHRVEREALTELAVIEGRGATASPDGARIAYLRVPETAELAAAREAAGRAQGAALRQARAEIARHEATAAEVVVREVTTGAESVAATPGMERYSLLYAGDGSLILVGRAAGEDDRTNLYRAGPDAAPEALTAGPGVRGATLLPVGQDRILYSVDGEGFVVRELATGRERAFAGSSPTVSADGSTVAYLTTREVPDEVRRGEAVVGADGRGRGHLTSLMVARLAGDAEPVEIRRTTLPLSDPALSPSGRRVAYQVVLRDDWEIFVADTGTGAEERLTREIQHDLFPRWLSEDRLMAMMGEFRHRRAYMYDLGPERLAEIATDPLPGRDMRGRTRLFHNNTLRTVAPQYEWEPDPAGNRILVVADRDGNTLTERGVYLIDLDRPVTREELLERIRTQLAAELDLRERGRRLFAPIEAEARAATSEISVGRIYDHAHSLYQFGSKWFAEPGNQLAVEYLANAFREMGYEPELQWFEPRPGVRSANVVATLRGTERPDRVHVISSHFDSVEPSPGADDNSSGTTAMLEAARVLASRPQAETIRFALLTAEETGLLGAREYVRRAQEKGENIVSVINNDMVGWTRSHRLDNTVRYTNSAIRDTQHAAAVLFSDLVTYDSRYVRNTDAHVFWDAYGDVIGGTGSYPILSNPHYHQRHDILEVIDQRLVAEVSRTTTAAIMALASGLVDVEGARRD
jgi:hypothetical protein